MPKHWSEILECSCGMRFRTALEEARHRHNFPALCKRKKVIRCEAGEGQRCFPRDLNCRYPKCKDVVS